MTRENRFCNAVRESYVQYLNHGGRSTQKLKPLHGWVISELKSEFKSKFEVHGESLEGGKEHKIEGRYYPKRVDVCVSHLNIELGVVSVKFPVRSYLKNRINQFESQLGETANLRSKDLVFGHLFVYPNPIPNLSSRHVTNYEQINDKVIDLYHKLIDDFNSTHAPTVQGLVPVKVSKRGERVTGVSICRREDLPDVSDQNWEILRRQMSIDRFIQVMVSSINAKWVKINTGVRVNEGVSAPG